MAIKIFRRIRQSIISVPNAGDVPEALHGHPNGIVINGLLDNIDRKAVAIMQLFHAMQLQGYFGQACP